MAFFLHLRFTRAENSGDGEPVRPEDLEKGSLSPSPRSGHQVWRFGTQIQPMGLVELPP